MSLEKVKRRRRTFTLVTMSSVAGRKNGTHLGRRRRRRRLPLVPIIGEVMHERVKYHNLQSSGSA